ncbi:MAG: isoprenylcysteine carboxylmethyltransferase family protein [Betaproteobacteria bacterium]|nr:isoprenylcysteine carboxylmethyltransferase family protein [Betaproteobacteria bacterium]
MSEAATGIALFAAGSAVLAWLSRKPLRHPGSHGFYRFFAWEGILAVVVMNRGPWGEDPFSPHQIASWLLMLASISLALAGYGGLRAARGSGGRADGSLYDWEKTGALVTSGVFAHIRHPMYTALLLLAWGAFMQAPGWAGAAAATTTSVCLYLTARADERECLAWFGPAYTDYMRRTRMFVPLVL